MERGWTSSSTGFAGTCSSSPERVGRDGLLQLRFDHRNQRTVLSKCRFRLPLQALAATELDDGAACLMMLNPTGGVVGGDVLSTNVIQGDDTRVCLTTPSATRIYRTLGPAAVLETRISLGERARLEYLPDHVIPHRDSRLRQTLHIDMARGGRAIVWDAMAAGRIAHGERWDFIEVDSSVEIVVAGSPVFCNRMRILPVSMAPGRLGFAEGFGYLATLILVAEDVTDWPAIVAAMHSELDSAAHVAMLGGASSLGGGGCVVKLLARSAADLARAQTALWARARAVLFGLPPADLRKY